MAAAEPGVLFAPQCSLVGQPEPCLISGKAWVFAPRGMFAVLSAVDTDGNGVCYNQDAASQSAQPDRLGTAEKPGLRWNTQQKSNPKLTKGTEKSTAATTIHNGNTRKGTAKQGAHQQQDRQW